MWWSSPTMVSLPQALSKAMLSMDSIHCGFIIFRCIGISIEVWLKGINFR